MAVTERAYTEFYVVPGGAGIADGSSFADAFDITQVAAALVGGARFNFAGNFTLAASLSWTVAGFSGGQVFFRGWKSDQSAVSESFVDNPIIDGASTYAVSTNSHHIYKGLRFTRLSLAFGTVAGDYIVFDGVEIDNGVGPGARFDNYCHVYRSRIHSNGGDGIQADQFFSSAFSQFYDNSGYGMNALGSLGMVAHNNLFARNTNGLRTAANGAMINNNTFDDNTTAGVVLGASNGPYSMMANIFSNEVTAISGNSNGSGLVVFNNFFNNGADSAAERPYVRDNTFVDPQYVNIAANDYEIQNTDLIDVAVPLLGNTTIGAWQPDGGGGGGGGMIVHPGMSGGTRG